MIAVHYRSSGRLQSLRISRRCYRLLDRAVIAPENLRHFYRTYRLPADPFFPLFFRIKRTWLENQQRKKEARERYILEKMRSLPRERLRYIRFLAEWEGSLNPAGDYPVWSDHLYPATKKRVHEYLTFDVREWDRFTRDFLVCLKDRYGQIQDVRAEEILACGFLGLVPRAVPFGLPGEEDLRRVCRRLSREYHPDSGGDARLFIRMRQAREVLVDHFQAEKNTAP